MDHNNPLQQYFRAPGISIRLPSMGKFQDLNNISFTATGELPVLPMRSADELLMKNPDSLMSGFAIQEVIKSCCPGIKDAGQLPAPDVDAILLAIRAATYGDSMVVETQCPECNTESELTVNIPLMLETISLLEDEYTVRLTDELIVYLRPFNFKNNTQASTVVFHETRKIQLLDRQELTDQAKQEVINASYKTLHDMNVRMIADCIEKVVSPIGTTTDRNHISEFAHNIESGWTSKLENVLKGINEAGVYKKHEVECSKCNHVWETTVEFNPASFFGQGS